MYDVARRGTYVIHVKNKDKNDIKKIEDKNTVHQTGFSNR